MNFSDRIRVETRSSGTLRCEAARREGGPCGKQLEYDLARRSVEVLESDGRLVAKDVAYIEKTITANAVVGGWSMIEDERGLYIVCPSCHRRERWVKIEE